MAGAGAAVVAGAAATTAAGTGAALGADPKYPGRLDGTQPGVLGSSTGGAPPATSRRTSTMIFCGDVDSAVVATLLAVAESTLTNGPMNDIRMTFALIAAPARITRVEAAACPRLDRFLDPDAGRYGLGAGAAGTAAGVAC